MLTEDRKMPESGATHPICILMDEHEVIHQNLAELQRLAGEINVSLRSSGDTLRLKGIAHLLLEAESHHNREEKTLFARLERQGMTDLVRLLYQEHQQMRRKKRELSELIEQADNIESLAFTQRLSEIGGYLVNSLTDHIRKEEEKLYVTALNTFDFEEWPKIGAEFDSLGYCAFTDRAEWQGCARCVLPCPRQE